MVRTKLILASQSPRRRELMARAGYQFEVIPPSSQAECGVCSRETPPELVARLAYQKAKDVAGRVSEGIVVGCDTVAECHGHILGKPANRQHAQEMLELMRGRPHHVYSGLCVWRCTDDRSIINVDRTHLVMDKLSDHQIQEYLDSGQWRGKAGGFGLQDRLGWIRIIGGSESNVVGLPLELLATMLAEQGLQV